MRCPSPPLAAGTGEGAALCPRTAGTRRELDAAGTRPWVAGSGAQPAWPRVPRQAGKFDRGFSLLVSRLRGASRFLS